MKRHIWQKYTNVLQFNKLTQFIPTFAAFKRGIFLDEKYSFEKGKLKAWVEFTDPTNTIGLLGYTFGNDPFSAMEWGQPNSKSEIQGKKFQRRAVLYIAKSGIHILNGHLND